MIANATCSTKTKNGSQFIDYLTMANQLHWFGHLSLVSNSHRRNETAFLGDGEGRWGLLWYPNLTRWVHQSVGSSFSLRTCTEQSEYIKLTKNPHPGEKTFWLRPSEGYPKAQTWKARRTRRIAFTYHRSRSRPRVPNRVRGRKPHTGVWTTVTP